MFDRIRRSTSTIDAEELKGQAAGLGAALSDASAQAGVAAAKLAEEARLAALHAKDWAGPRVEKALREAAKAAEPRVERAAERAVPIVDSAHDRFVEDILPKIVAAVSTAASAAAAGADKARDAADAKLTELAHLEVPEPRRSRTGAKIFWLIAGLAAIGAAIAAWTRSKPTTDPWAEQPWEPVEEDHGADRFKAAAADVKYELGDAAEAVGEATGGAVARTREATEKAAERAREATERAREATEKAAERAREATRRAAPRRRSTAAADTPVLGGDEVTETIPTQEDTMSTYDDAGVTPVPEPLEVGETIDPLDSQKIPTDIPGQPGDPLNTAKSDEDDVL